MSFIITDLDDIDFVDTEGNSGFHDSSTDTISLDIDLINYTIDHYVDAKEAVNTLIHESLHKNRPKGQQPNPHKPGDDIYRDARKRTQQIDNKEYKSCL